MSARAQSTSLVSVFKRPLMGSKCEFQAWGCFPQLIYLQHRAWRLRKAALEGKLIPPPYFTAHHEHVSSLWALGGQGSGSKGKGKETVKVGGTSAGRRGREGGGRESFPSWRHSNRANKLLKKNTCTSGTANKLSGLNKFGCPLSETSARTSCEQRGDFNNYQTAKPQEFQASYLTQWGRINCARLFIHYIKVSKAMQACLHEQTE